MKREEQIKNDEHPTVEELRRRRAKTANKMNTNVKADGTVVADEQ